MHSNKTIEEQLFGKLDLSGTLNRWKGGLEISKEKYLNILKKDYSGDFFCISFCSGCGSITSMDKNLAKSYFHDFFSGVYHPFQDQLEKIDKNIEYVHMNVCHTCSLSLSNLEKQGKIKVEINPIPRIQKIQ